MSLLVVIHLLIAAPDGAAQAPAPLELPESGTWYGWETLLSDAASTLLLGGGVTFITDSRFGAGAAGVGLVLAGTGLYVFGGPAMHWRRGLSDRGLTDLAFRVLFPLGGAVVGFVLGSVGYAGASYGAAGILLGAAAAVLSDAAALSWEPLAPPAPRTAPAAPAAPQVTPMVGVTRGAPFAGLAGTF